MDVIDITAFREERATERVVARARNAGRAVTDLRSLEDDVDKALASLAAQGIHVQRTAPIATGDGED